MSDFKTIITKKITSPPKGKEVNKEKVKKNEASVDVKKKNI